MSSDNAREKLILVDGNSIINRAFFGVPDLTNAEGLHTNAIYGFINILFRILNEENGDYLCVAFDVHAPTFRHEMYPAYKGTRKGMPEELKEQVPHLKRLLDAMGITRIEKAGYEADDILGTLAKRGEKDGLYVTLVSGDRDLLQIASDNIMIRIPKTKGGKTDIENYNTKDVIEKYGLEPLQIIELKALMGDSSDNIPGVPKIGEKTATELLKTYHDIENLKNHIPEIAKNSIRQTLTDNFDMAVMSKTLATIDTNATIDFDLENARIKDLYTKEAYAIVKEFGFKNILSRFDEANTKIDEDYKDGFRNITDFSEVNDIFNCIKSKENISFEFLGESIGIGKDKKIDCLGLSIGLDEKDIVYIPIQGFVTQEYLVSSFIDAVNSNDEIKITTFDIKKQLIFIDEMSDPDFLKNHVIDVAIGAYVCNPLKNDYEIDDIASEYLNLVIKNKNEIFGKENISSFVNGEEDKITDYVCTRCYVAYCAKEKILNRIHEYNMDSLYKDIEIPLAGCLYRMEKEGIKIIPEELSSMGEQLKEQIGKLEQEILSEAGEEFNINSPIQLGEILFGKMGLPGGKKTKKGYSTAADVLEKLAPDYPFVAKILEFRALSKLKSTYTDGLVPYIGADERIHSTFNQMITATGRISSTEPNLQNIPVRLEQGRLIRKAFVPKEGCVFVDADYSQIELRIMAHLSGDANMQEAFVSGADIHTITASKVFNVPVDEVTSLQRRNAKAVNFGIIYGISAYGLSQDIGSTQKEAKAFIEQYFETFPQVKEYIDRCVAEAKEKGYVVTSYGRRRPLPEITSSNFMQRAFGERVAMNAPIQGTAADIMKIAMIRVENRLRKEKLQSKIILQVHDELMIETYQDEIEAVSSLLKEEMEGAANLSVPMPVELTVSNNWYEAK